MKKLVLLLILFTAIGFMGCSKSKDDNKEADSDNITREAENNITPAVTAAPTEAPAAEASADGSDAAQTKETLEGSVVEAEIQSAAIAENLIDEKGTRKLFIYLPPSYSSGDKTYPVVYFLHGYGDSPKSFMASYEQKLNMAFTDGAQEFILVALDGNNLTGGSFYVNSPVTGNWEDYVVKEVVDYMDTNYRTIADSASRGMSGYSMGGFGALYISLRHPDIFNSTLVFCPGVFAEDSLDAVIASWTGWADVNKSYAQAFSPNPGDPINHGNIISAKDIQDKNTTWSDWMNGYSNWGKKLEDYVALNKPLKAIKLAYSPQDSFPWIPTGCKYLADLLEKNSVNYSTQEFDGGHVVPLDGIENYFIPFFGENLTY